MVELTLREQVLTLLKEKGPMNIQDLTRETTQTRQYVSEKLNLARRKGQVKDKFIKKQLPWGGFVLSHYWMITKTGEKWLKEKKI